jgi:putative transposase
MLSDREAAYKNEKQIVFPTPAQYKAEYPFLREVDSLALANVQLNLQQAYKAFFTVKGTGHPKFKSKHRARNTYTTNNQNGTIRIDFERGTIQLPKIGKLKAVLHRKPCTSWKLKSATVSQNRSGRYFCSVLFEYESFVRPVKHPQQNAIGLDYKSDGLYVDSNGHTCGSPKLFRKGQKTLTRAQRRLRHKKVGSRNYEKAKKKIAKAHRHIANQRKDFLHKQSTAIAKQYDMVCVEDLNMRDMSNKGFGNGKATMDNGYGMFCRMLEYKLKERGKVFIRVDKWFASSQLCSCCHTKNPAVKDLSIREWTCPVCGTHHDRDINAAINIKRKGVMQYLA